LSEETTMPNAMRPIPPGDILRQELEELELSASAFARTLRVPPNRVTGILHGTRAISADTALRLARYFGTTPEFWLNLQQAYDLRRARRSTGKEIERQVQPRAA
jgi:addiction module HigA family antidote